MEKTTVVISGREYSILSEEGGEYANRIAYELDQRIREIIAKYAGVATNTATVLTALNLTDELHKANAALTDVKKELRASQTALKKAETALSEAEEKSRRAAEETLQKLQRRLDALEQENVRLRAGQRR
ncbi:MAG: cell division protein ZapA [Christensenellaceae bacterium]|jgi:cell division protein ZapA